MTMRTTLVTLIFSLAVHSAAAQQPTLPVELTRSVTLSLA